MAYEAPAVPDGWKTIREWCRESSTPKRTFENQMQRLLELGHAKAQKFTDDMGRIRLYYWINNLSDEDHG